MATLWASRPLGSRLEGSTRLASVVSAIVRAARSYVALNAHPSAHFAPSEERAADLRPTRAMCIGRTL